VSENSKDRETGQAGSGQELSDEDLKGAAGGFGALVSVAFWQAAKKLITKPPDNSGNPGNAGDAKNDGSHNTNNGMQ
jgi:hypothetical protein